MFFSAYFFSKRGDFRIISVTGNFLLALRSKNNSSVKNPETGTNCQSVEFSIKGEIASNSGNRSVGMGSVRIPRRYSLQTY